MTKIQTIFCLFLFLVIVFSMDMIFGNPIRETFSNQIGLPGGRNVGIDGVGFGRSSELNHRPVIRTNTKNGNMIYSGSGFLGATAPYPKGDDQPLFFGFSN
jgi:hypothetical protein